MKKLICNGCNTLKEVKEFTKEKQNKHGVRLSCKECEKKRRNSSVKDAPSKVKFPKVTLALSNFVFWGAGIWTSKARGGK